LQKHTKLAILCGWPQRSRHSEKSAESAIRSSNSEMTQTSSAIIVAIKTSMEYAKMCMSMRLGNARYSA
jgi:hypothetical protein